MSQDLIFRQAQVKDLDSIWEILQGAILRRKADGSSQWQDGYPNPEVIQRDINAQAAFVAEENGVIAGYIAIMINDEPAYDQLIGNWLSNEDFVVFHRVAIHTSYIGKGFAKKLLEFVEEFASNQGIKSIKADTNHDNGPMLHLFNEFGYHFCGEVTFRGTPRKAFEKRLL